MKATLIEFKKMVIDVPSFKPWIKRREVAGMPANFNGENIDPNYFGGVDKEYRLIELHSVKKDGTRRTERYFVNIDDIEACFPIIKAMIQEQTKGLEKRHIGDVEVMAMLHDEIKYLRLPWYKKLLYKKK